MPSNGKASMCAAFVAADAAVLTSQPCWIRSGPLPFGTVVECNVDVGPVVLVEVVLVEVGVLAGGALVVVVGLVVVVVVAGEGRPRCVVDGAGNDVVEGNVLGAAVTEVLVCSAAIEVIVEGTVVAVDGRGRGDGTGPGCPA